MDAWFSGLVGLVSWRTRWLGRTGIGRQARIRWIMYQRYCSVDRLEASSSSYSTRQVRCVPILLVLSCVVVVVAVAVACIEEQIILCTMDQNL